MSLASRISALATAIGQAIKAHLTGFHGGELGRGFVVLSSDFVKAGNTIEDVPGLEFPVVAGETYRFRYMIPYDTSANNVGSRWSINGPAFTRLNFTSSYGNNVTNRVTNNAGNYDEGATSGATSGTGNVAIIEGVITPSASGSVMARVASENNNPVTAFAGASVEWNRIL